MTLDLKTASIKDLLKEVKTFADLKAIGEARGFHPGWAHFRAQVMKIPVPPH